MINHVRTLLLNADPGSYAYDQPGEEYVPSAYLTRPLPTVLQTPHRILFGTQPDRLYLCYRLWQYMNLLHATPLAEYVTSPDPRITYWPSLLRDPFAAAFGSRATQISGSPDLVLSLEGDLVADERLGQLRQRWRVAVLSETEVEVRRLVPPLTTTSVTLSMPNQLSNLIPLGGGLYARIGGAPELLDGAAWVVDAAARPTLDLSSLLTQLQRGLGETHQFALFGVVPVEPYLTLSNLWQSELVSLQLRLGALLVALAYRINELTP